MVRCTIDGQAAALSAEGSSDEGFYELWHAIEGGKGWVKTYEKGQCVNTSAFDDYGKARGAFDALVA